MLSNKIENLRWAKEHSNGFNVLNVSQNTEDRQILKPTCGFILEKRLTIVSNLGVASP